MATRKTQIEAAEMYSRIVVLSLFLATILLAKSDHFLEQNITVGAFYDHLVFVNKKEPMWFNDLDLPRSQKERNEILYMPGQKEKTVRLDMGRYEVLIYDDRYLMVFQKGLLTHTLILQKNFGNIEFKRGLTYRLKVHYDTIEIILRDHRFDTEWIGDYVPGPAYDVYWYELLRFKIDQSGKLSFVGKDSFRKEDAKLNRSYRKLLSVAPKWAKQEIAKEQRAWLSIRSHDAVVIM